MDYCDDRERMLSYGIVFYTVSLVEARASEY